MWICSAILNSSGLFLLVVAIQFHHQLLFFSALFCLVFWRCVSRCCFQFCLMKSIRSFSRELFENPAFRPDGLKIYPTLVIRGTGLCDAPPSFACLLAAFPSLSLCFFAIHSISFCAEFSCLMRVVRRYELWKSGAFVNYPPDTLVDVVARILALVPPWTRVYR
jgi:hypothetical protein